MITLKNPPRPVNRVLHLNCPSTSPGGKDYVIALLDNGDVWTVYGSASDVRSGRGVAGPCNKDMGNVLNEKLRKGYREIGGYSAGMWRSSIGETYYAPPNAPNIHPPLQANPAPKPEPKPIPAVAAQQPTSLAEQYPLGEKVRAAFSSLPTGSDEWFCVF